jgi:hypothetical protein
MKFEDEKLGTLFRCLGRWEGCDKKCIVFLSEFDVSDPWCRLINLCQPQSPSSGCWYFSNDFSTIKDYSQFQRLTDDEDPTPR